MSKKAADGEQTWGNNSGANDEFKKIQKTVRLQIVAK